MRCACHPPPAREKDAGVLYGVEAPQSRCSCRWLCFCNGLWGARVERDVRAMPGVKVVSFDIRLRVWPHCEVVDLLRPYQSRNRDPSWGLRLAAQSAHEGRLREGDSVRIEVITPGYDSYLSRRLLHR